MTSGLGLGATLLAGVVEVSVAVSVSVVEGREKFGAIVSVRPVSVLGSVESVPVGVGSVVESVTLVGDEPYSVEIPSVAVSVSVGSSVDGSSVQVLFPSPLGTPVASG